MFLQEVAKAESLSELTKFIFGVLILVISNLITFYAGRPKSQSEIDKNEADTQKSEAETVKLKADTIKLLTDELDETIEKVKGLRGEVGILEDLNKTLKQTIDKYDLKEQDALNKLYRLFNEEKAEVLRAIAKTIVAVQSLIDDMSGKEVPQDIRMAAVKVLEHLYVVRNYLEK